MCQGGRPEAASMASRRGPQPEQEAAGGGGGGGGAEATRRRPRGWRAVAFIIGASLAVHPRICLQLQCFSNGNGINV